MPSETDKARIPTAARVRLRTPPPSPSGQDGGSSAALSEVRRLAGNRGLTELLAQRGLLARRPDPVQRLGPDPSGPAAQLTEARARGALDRSASAPAAVGAVGGQAVQRNGPDNDAPPRVVDPGVSATHGVLLSFCARGEGVAWDLYRAVLDIETVRLNQAHGRMQTDQQAEATVGRAATARAQAISDFARLRTEGSAAWAAYQAELAKANPDELTLNEHILTVVERTDAAARAIGQVAERAWRAAVNAEEGGYLVAARHAFKAADEGEAVLGERRPAIPLRGGRVSPDLLGTFYSVGVDTAANTVVGGPYGSIVTGLTYQAASGSQLAALGSGTGYVLGPLGVICSSIDLILGVVGAVKSGNRKSELEKLRSHLADPRARAILDYSIDQKRAKRDHRWFSAATSTVGLAAGIATCVALGVASFGIGALIIGVIAAAIGLSVLAYKWYRKSQRGQLAKFKGFAKSIITTASDPKADAADRELAQEWIRKLGLEPASASGAPDFSQTDVKALTQKLKELGSTRRQQTAEGLLYLLVNGTRSQRRDAGLVLTALKLKPDELQAKVESGSGSAAVAAIAAKLASW